VSFQLLDPTQDIVFKLLLTRYQSLLHDMIDAVLSPRVLLGEPIILNPEIPKAIPLGKTIVLDVRARFADGSEVDLEMQSTSPAGVTSRFLYYWAKTYASRIGSGEDYTSLHPCISILWFKEPVLRGTAKFHSHFDLRERDSGAIFSTDIEFHVLELPRLHLAAAETGAKLLLWARFLRAQTVGEFEQLAREDAIMNVAKEALFELSSDPDAQRLAQEREMAEVAHRHLLGASFQAGREEGREESRIEERADKVVMLCRIFDIKLDAAKSAKLSSLDVHQLNDLATRLEREHLWPEDM
jgi:predicted transposase/invertase (TIGR01784 family)